MGILVIKPTLNELYGFIEQVRSYPVSTGQLLQLAGDIDAPKPVIDFYKAFRGDQVFADRDDLTGRSEQLDILMQEEDEMPQELERAPEEY